MQHDDNSTCYVNYKSKKIKKTAVIYLNRLVAAKIKQIFYKK